MEKKPYSRTVRLVTVITLFQLASFLLGQFQNTFDYMSHLEYCRSVLRESAEHVATKLRNRRVGNGFENRIHFDIHSAGAGRRLKRRHLCQNDSQTEDVDCWKCF